MLSGFLTKTRQRGLGGSASREGCALAVKMLPIWDFSGRREDEISCWDYRDMAGNDRGKCCLSIFKFPKHLHSSYLIVLPKSSAVN